MRANSCGSRLAPADERAVDVGLRHQHVDVGGLDAAAVEDADAVGGVAEALPAPCAGKNATVSWAISGVAVLPVPIAQMGS